MRDEYFDFSTALLSLPGVLSNDETDHEDNNLQNVLSLPRVIIQCYAAVSTHLAEFKLDRFLKFSKQVFSLNSNLARTFFY